jgi:excisionase family DNA binding protein
MNQSSLFYTPKEIADLLKVSERTVRRWIGEGKLWARRFGQSSNLPGRKGARRTQDWLALAADSFAQDWDKDAKYDRWREHYGLSDFSLRG